MNVQLYRNFSSLSLISDCVYENVKFNFSALIVCTFVYTVKPPNKQPAMAEHTAYTEQFPWSQHVALTYTWAENARF